MYIISIMVKIDKKVEINQIDSKEMDFWGSNPMPYSSTMEDNLGRGRHSCMK